MKRTVPSLLAAIFLMSMLLAGCRSKANSTSSVSFESSGTSSLPDSIVTAESLGASPNDDEDDYAAVSAALSKGKNIYFDAGTYTFSKTLHIKNQQLIGLGQSQTQLVYTGKDKGALIQAEGACTIAELALLVDKSLITGQEKEGESVLLWCGGDTPLRNASIRNVSFGNAGTSIYAPSDKKAAVCNTTFDTLEIASCTFRGVDLRSPDRTDNTFINVYSGHASIDDKEYTPQSIFSLTGGDTGLKINQLNVEHTVSLQPIILNDCSEADISTIHVEGVTIGRDDSGYLNLENTTGRIGALTVYYTPVDHDRDSVIRFGNAEKTSKLQIDVLHLKGLNDPNAELHGARTGGLLLNHGKSFVMMARDSSATGEYSVNTDSYVYYTFQSDSKLYEQFPTAGPVTFTKIGVLPESGTTKERPTTRLSKNCTTYFDTTLGKLLLWNGTKWVEDTEK